MQTRDTTSPMFSALSGRTAVVDGAETPLGRACLAALKRAGMKCGEAQADSPDLYVLAGPQHEAFGATDALCDTFIDRDRVESVARTMAARGSGRMILVTNEAYRRVLAPSSASTGPDLAAEAHWWRHLAARMAGRGVIVNMIALGYAPFAGHTLPVAEEDDYLRHLAIRRPAEEIDLQGALLFLASDDSSAMVGQTISLSGGLGLFIFPSAPKPGGHKAIGKGVAGDALGDTFSLRGRRILVVGASTGIGRATALELAARGAEVAVAARSAHGLEALVEEIARAGGRARSVPLDVTEKDVLVGTLRELWSSWDGPDCLIYAAGYLPLKSDDIGDDGHERTFAVNFDGFVHATRTIIELWTKSKRPGTIVSISSIGAEEAVIVPNLESYAASKAAMTQYTRALATTYGRFGIRANCIQPGIVRTPMAEWIDSYFQECWLARMPLGRVCEPEEIARVAAYLASPAAAYLTGEIIKVDGGFSLGQIEPLERTRA